MGRYDGSLPPYHNPFTDPPTHNSIPAQTPRQAYKYAIFEGGHFKRWEALDIPRVVCIEEFHAQLDDVLDQVGTHVHM